MIKARHTPWFQSVFGIYLSWAFRRNFHKMEIHGNIVDKDLPLLVIANHMSWWDGFWMLHLNKKLFKRKFFVMMLEEQLSRNKFLSKLGAFSIKKRSKSATESLNYASNLLKDKSNLFLIFPQGEIQSQHNYPFVFEKGWGRIVLQNENPVQVIMVANIVDYFSHKKPVLRQYVFSPDETKGFTCDELEEKYNTFYKDCMQHQMQNSR